MDLFPPIGQLGLLRTLRYRDFRLLVLSSSLWFATRWMQLVVISWLVLELTDSPFMVGAVAGVRFVGNLITPFTGAVADRANRRRILLLFQALNTLGSGLFFLLLATGWIQVWHAFALVLVNGILHSFDYPARNALAVGLVPRDDLPNAVALNRAASDMTAVIGPIVGGTFVGLIGFAAAYGTVFTLNLVNLTVLLLISGAAAAVPAEVKSVWRYLIEGWRECRRDSPLLAVLTLAALANLLTFPLTHSLMPVFAREVLGVGAAGYGLLTGAVGAGAFTASFSLASLSRGRRWGRLMVAGFILWPILMIIFAVLPRFYLSLPLLVVLGLTQATAMVTSTAFLLDRVSAEMRGRVMGLRGLAVTTLPLGNFVGGALTEWLGAPAALVLYGSVAVLSMAAIALGTRELRRWRSTAG